MKTLSLLVLFFASQVLFAQTRLLYFEKDGYQLNQESASVLDDLIFELKATKNNRDIAIIGHTDKDASEEYNKELALNRTRSVKDYLTERDIYNRFHLLSMGEMNPINANIDENQKKVNRRVEIVLNYQLKNDVKNVFQQAPQEFKIGPFESKKITTAYGTQIHFEKNLFDSVLPHLPIKIVIQEYYDKADFVLANLTTETSDNRRLESKGMINIQAVQNGDTLKLKKGNSFNILFPDREISDDMQLFEGAVHNEKISWDQTTFTPSRSFSNSGWSTTYYPGGDTISRSKWWYEKIGGETYKIERTEHLRLNKITIDTTDVENEKLLDELLMASTNVGWINCDRFWNDNSPKEDVIVEFTGEFVPVVTLVFDDIKSVLPYSYREDNRLIFKNIPINRDITIIGLHHTKDDNETLFAIQKSTSKKGLNEKLHFERKRYEEIKSKLANL